VSDLRGLLGLAAILALAFLVSNNRGRIPWRTVVVGLAIQVAFAALVLRWSVGRDALDFVAGQVTALIDYTNDGVDFLFGDLVADKQETIFALQVLPVIIFLGALVGMLYYLRVIQWVVETGGGAIAWLLRTSKVESLYAATVIFLGQSEAPLMIQSYLKRLTSSELFAVMTGGFASVAGSTLVGYALLGAPLPYLLAATVMNAPASLYIAKMIVPRGRGVDEQRRRARRARHGVVQRDRRHGPGSGQRGQDRRDRRLPADRVHRPDRPGQRAADGSR
jgi:concentrative nucleoside transporter, CNT family